jgi:hypothetical protein
MSAAFSQALVRGLGAHLPSSTSATSAGVMPYSGAKASSTSHGYIAQKSGDPNYYATTPKFDSRGFWQAAGSNPPREPPKGSPATPTQGEWLQQGTTIRNGQTTPLWVWYPPKDKPVIFGKNKTGERNYLVSRNKPTESSKQLFIIPPEYWVHEYVVASPPPPPKSSYKPQKLEYDTVEDIVPVVGTFHCQRWLLVATQNVSKLNATLGVIGMFSPKAVFNYYIHYVGVSPYFTWNGYLFKFEYTGYDSKTGKYRHGSQYKNIISICTDGLNVQKNPPGDASNYTVFAPGGSGGVSVVHRRGTHGVGLEPKENSMESAFSTGGLGKTFDPALIRGLGQLVSGESLRALTPSSVPLVYNSDWIEFYPNDPYFYQANTNLGFGPLPQNGYGLIGQINSSAPGTTTYWLFTDSNSGAAWTVSSLGAGVALIRSSYPGGSLKLEIARKTVPAPMKLVSGASLPTLPANPLWELTGVAVASGKTVSLSPSKQAQQANYYLQYLQQPQFNDGVPSAGASWTGWEPAPVPTSYPDAYFSYKGQNYQIRSDGNVYVDTRPLALKPLPFPFPVSPKPVPGTSPVTSPVLPHMPLPSPSTPPVWARPIAVSGPLPPAMTPPWTQPVTLPSGVQSAAAAALQAAQAVTASPAATTSNIPPAAAIAMGLIGAGILGGVLYLVFE